MNDMCVAVSLAFTRYRNAVCLLFHKHCAASFDLPVWVKLVYFD